MHHQNMAVHFGKRNQKHQAMKTIIKCSLLLLLVGTIISCSDRKPSQQSDPRDFEQYIAAHTSGSVAAGAAIQIRLSKRVSAIEPGSLVPRGTIKISPTIKGDAFLTDPFTIEFRPYEAWKNGNEYSVGLDLKSLFEMEDELQYFNFSFSVIQQDFSVFQGRLVTDFYENNTSKKYEGKLITADEMTVEDAGKLLSATSPAGAIPVEISQSGPREFDYAVKNIMRKEDAYRITLSWDGSPAGIERKGSFDIEVPSANELSLLQVKLNRTANPNTISLIFSDPPDPSQNLY